MNGDGPRRAFRMPSWTRRQARDSVDEELEFHLGQAAKEFESAGASPDEARELALADFGDLEFTRDYCTNQHERAAKGRRGMGHMEGFLQDLKYGIRTLLKNPGYSFVIVLTLAVGIGANVSIFSLLNPYLFRPLAFEDEDALVQLGQIDPAQQFEHRHALQQLADYERQSRAFESMGAYFYGTANLTGDEGAERVILSWVTDDMMDVLGTDPVLGRAFLPGEQGPGTDAILLDHGLWTRRYGADPGILGTSVMVDGAPRTVVGVMPPEFGFPFNEVKLWAPMENLPTSDPRDDNYMLIVGRLNDGWTLEAAEAELNQIHQGLAREYPDADGRYDRVSVTAIRPALNFAWDPLRWGAIVLGAAMGALLLIACVNVAGLMLARSAVRAREISIRAAVGAARGRLVRQLLAESLLLSLVGGALGVGLASVLIGTVSATLPDSLFRVGDPSTDRRVLGFSLALTLLTPFLFGLLPALRASRADLVTALKTGQAKARGAGLGGRRTLIGAQMALALVLVATTGLMVRSFVALQQVDLGFDPDRAVVAELSPGEADFPSRSDVDGYYERALAALAGVPGVRASATTVPLPMNHELISTSYAAPQQTGTDTEDWPRAMYFRVSDGYFEAMGVELLAGRGFDPRDGAESEPTVILSESVAGRLWPGQEAVGRMALLGHSDPPTEARVVGVAEDVSEEGFADVFGGQIYRPAAQSYQRSRYIVVGTEGPPSAMINPVSQALRGAGPSVPALVRPMQAVVDENTLGWSVPSLLLGIAGLIAIGLASLGIYGLISYQTLQRRTEMGVRLALGATAAQVRMDVMREGIRMAIPGLLIGLGLSAVAGQLLASRLYGVGPRDPITFIGTALLFATVAVAAAARPAVQASRTAPVRVLKAD